jgi:hypothetical protein
MQFNICVFLGTTQVSSDVQGSMLVVNHRAIVGFVVVVVVVLQTVM